MRDTILTAALLACLLYAATARGESPATPNHETAKSQRSDGTAGKPRPDFLKKPKDGKLPRIDGQKPIKLPERAGQAVKPLGGKRSSLGKR